MDTYKDILEKERPASNRRKMTLEERAAQFSPFAALTGYGAAVEEAGRLTQKRREPSEEERELLDRQLTYLKAHLSEKHTLTVTYFLPDLLKAGGSYETHRGILLRIDSITRCLVFEDGKTIPLDDVVQIEAEEKEGEGE